jgi:3,4-dihydroxy 2-butanone 4-phosphate synthase/GTP cyclohydrolase II
MSRAPAVRRGATVPLPTTYGTFQARGYGSADEGREHLALTMGSLRGGAPVLTRIHVRCIAGDVLHSSRCECRRVLEGSLRRIAAEDRGVLVYVHPDAIPAQCGAPAAADLAVGAQILRDLGVRDVRLLDGAAPAIGAGGLRVVGHVSALPPAGAGRPS